MEAAAPKVLKIFYCYARKDKPLREEMDLHLSTLKRQNHIITWADHEIAPGEDWAKSIDIHLNEADIIFLLISPNFMSSDYCYGTEMQRALQRHEQKQARVIPIILRPVDWEDAPFSKLQVLPTNATPVTIWPDRDAAFADIVKNLRPMIKELRNRLRTKEEWLAEAEALLGQDRHEDALAALNQALVLDPNFVLALIYRGGAYKQLLDYKKALDDFDRALSLDPKNASLLMLRGDAYRLQGDYPKALADLNQALAIKPNDPATLARRGETYRLMNNYEKALADLDQALALAPGDTFALASRGDTHRFIGNYQQAVADFDHVLSLTPHNTTILTKRGDTHRLLKDYTKALSDFDEALALNPTFAAALAGRGDTYRLLKDYTKALADLDEAIFHNPRDEWALISRGETYQSIYQFNAALADFDRAINLSEENDWYKYKRAITNLFIGRREAAEKDIISAIEIARSRFAVLSSITERWRTAFNIALYHLVLEKYEVAEVLYENLINVCTLYARLYDAASDISEMSTIFNYASETLLDLKPTYFLLEDSKRIERIGQQILKRLTEIE